MEPKDPASCKHDQFHANVNVNKNPISGHVLATVRIVCLECGSPFRFLGVPSGLRIDVPRTSIDGLELRAPIAKGEIGLITPARFVPPRPPRRGN